MEGKNFAAFCFSFLGHDHVLEHFGEFCFDVMRGCRLECSSSVLGVGGGSWCWEVLLELV